MGHIFGLDGIWKKKKIPCSCRDLNPGPSSPQRVAVPTELSWLKTSGANCQDELCDPSEHLDIIACHPIQRFSQ